MNHARHASTSPRPRRIRRLGLAACLLFAGTFVSASPAGAVVPSWCDSVLPEGPFTDNPHVNVNAKFVTATNNVDDVTVEVRWVGAGLDLGPAPAGDPIFDTLPAGYTVTEPPTVARIETGVTASEPVNYNTIACSDNITVLTDTPPTDRSDSSAYSDFINSMLAYGDRVETLDWETTTTVIKTHHITETRTYTIVADQEPTTTTTTVPDSTTVPEPTTTPGPVTTSTPSAQVDAGHLATAPAATALSARPAYTG